MIATGGWASIAEERRGRYYELLAYETERLHRLVENLLSFSRIEAGAYAWHLQPVDVAALVRSVIEDFGRDAVGSARTVTWDATITCPRSPLTRTPFPARCGICWKRRQVL